MTAECITELALSKAYVTAFLLTGNSKQAENAVTEGIRRLDDSDASDEVLIRGSVDASLEHLGEVQEPDYASRLLPVQLRPVLNLLPDLRRCFVLRVLLGWPQDVCARLLHLSLRDVDDRSYQASLALAGLRAAEAHQYLN